MLSHTYRDVIDFENWSEDRRWSRQRDGAAVARDHAQPRGLHQSPAGSSDPHSSLCGDSVPDNRRLEFACTVANINRGRRRVGPRARLGVGGGEVRPLPIRLPLNEPEARLHAVPDQLYRRLGNIPGLVVHDHAGKLLRQAESG
eukprot:COSAG05_NODE_63_length_22889_cov_41.986617_9_plen_144_part_00